jgi:DNA-binding NtrC family response regulator
MDLAAELHVLCVDPDPNALEATAAAIDAEPDMRAVTAASAAAAVEATDSGDPDCLVTEFDIGGDTGIVLAERIRERRPGLGCILFTYATAETVANDEGDVLTEYLSKTGPEAHERLCDLVRTVVVSRFHVGYPVPADEDDRLAAVREYDVTALSAVEPFDRLTRLVASLFDIAVAFVGLLNAEHERFIACHGADWRPYDPA